MKTLLILTFGLAALALGLDKVRNEHRMTEMYERQAVALERIADSAQIRAQLRDKHDRVIMRYGARQETCTIDSAGHWVGCIAEWNR